MRKIMLLMLLLSLSIGLIHAQEIVGPDDYPEGINPLTGLPVDDPRVLNRRPFLMKIVNAPAEARPQWGLFEADVMWEYLLGGGYTRFVGVYLSNDPDHVGPIRSLRLPDFELTRIYRGITVTSGMADGMWESLWADPVMNVRTIVGGQGGDALYRDFAVNRSLEFTLFGDLLPLRAVAEELELDVTPEPLGGMAFSDSLPLGGVGLTGMEIRYAETDVRWTYEAELNVWLRETNGEIHTDAVRGEQFYVDNVVIVEEDHLVQPIIRDQYWGYTNFMYRSNFVGGGRAVLLRDGQYFEGVWQRSSHDGNLYFYDNAGNVLPFKPGRTLIEMVPRWIGGYQLIFDPVDPAIGTVTSTSVNLRWGPGTNFAARTGATRGTELMVIGRNNSGTWVQLNVDGNPLWVATDFIDLNVPLTSIPLVRPTNEE